jgi:hypothetical protein
MWRRPSTTTALIREAADLNHEEFEAAPRPTAVSWIRSDCSRLHHVHPHEGPRAPPELAARARCRPPGRRRWTIRA